jgi:hypothetical protein
MDVWRRAQITEGAEWIISGRRADDTNLVVGTLAQHQQIDAVYYS